LEAIARITAARRPIPTAKVGQSIASRYRLQRELGRGANGVVWEAHDTVTRTQVGVKLLATRSHAARTRSEVSSMRRLRLPGVARLLDEGIDGDYAFLVMPILRGSRFPGRPTPAAWSALIAPTELLLETIARVHAIGVVHRDLKPANVLVDEEGRPTLLDFGLSVLAGFGDIDPELGPVGTPAYLAPEQLVGHQVDARADLYAIGVMLYHALSGRFPHEATAVDELLASKHLPPPSLGEVAADVPPEVISAVDALLSTRPDDRPSSAAKALALLRGDRPPAPAPALWLEAGRDPAVSFTVDELRQLFAGEDRLTQLRTDAAHVLRERTGGIPGNVRSTIAAWVRAGRCRWDAGDERRLIIDRETLDELQGDLWTNLGAATITFLDEAVELSRALAERGRLGNAIVALHEALVVLRRAAPTDVARREKILGSWLEVALAEGTPHAIDRVLYEICRSERPTDLERQLETLARAALSVWAWSPRASELAESVPPFENPGLELRRWGVRMLAARRDTRERERIVAADVVTLAQRSPDPKLRESAQTFLGKLQYREGRYAEAARSHGTAARSLLWRTDRIAASLHAASAALEAFDEPQALDLGRRAREEARQSRNAYLTGRAEWVLRSVSYRLGQDHYVDDELLAAARALGAPDLVAMIGLVEATHAFRAADGRAATLALDAYQSWSMAGEPIASLLAGSLAAANGAELSGELYARLLDSAWSSDVPGIGVQAAALLRKGGLARPEEAVIERLASTVPRERWSRRMDILSVDESLALLSA
jgi:hypothetical protein